MALDVPQSESSIRRILRASPWDPREVLWTKVGICHALDFMHLGPLGSWGRLLTLQEERSRFKPLWELRPNWTSQTVARYLEEAWESLGVPLIVKHDQGPEFISSYFQGFLTAHHVLSLPNPPYRGSYNGKEERLNGFIRAWTRPLELHDRPDLLPQVLAEAYQDLNFERPLQVLGARTPYDVFSTARRVLPANRDDLLQAAERFTTMHACDLALKERGLLLKRKAAVVAAQEVGLLVIRPSQKCQPISA